jgi:hypothetical protein
VKKKAFAVKGPPIYNDDTPPSYNETAFEFHNARKCVAVIVELYRAICTKAGAADACEAATRILRGGATGCHKDSTMGAWNSVRNCLKKYR